MAIHKRGKVWWYRFSVNGRVYRGSCRTDDERLAREYHDRIKADAWRLRYLRDTVRRTWTETLDRWLHEHRHKKTHTDDIAYGNWWSGRFEQHRVVFLPQVTPDVVKTIRDLEISRPRQRNGKPIAPATVNRKIALLRAVINSAAREYQWLDVAPLFRCLPEKNERVRFITPPEINRLLQALAEPYRSMAMLAVATGLRLGNIKRLTWEQIDFARRQMTFPESVMKNGLPLSIPINDTALNALKPWVGKSKEWVFIRQDNNPVKEIPSKMWKQALIKAGLTNLKWHDLRHTWASLMRQAGEGLDKIQELGAWADARMVRRYAHLSVRHLSDAASTMDRVLVPSQQENVAQIRSHTS